jgi:two-component system, NtrC family, response regulator HupR/HoxA
MINWDEFEHIHVIRKLKQIIGSWWHIDVVFTDDKGRLRGVPDLAKITNPAVKTFLSKETSLDSLA